MTAEIAILNKLAVALAADSAVTISAGRREEKIFDSADKLFELSTQNPIGIMIYHGMSFMEAPLPSLIKQFRTGCGGFDRIDDAVEAFLAFLDDFGKSAHLDVKNRHIDRLIRPVIDGIINYVSTRLEKLVFEAEKMPENFSEVADGSLDEAIDLHLKVFMRSSDAKFVGDGTFCVGTDDQKRMRKLLAERMPMADAKQKRKVGKILELALRRSILSASKTGIVIAGFGKNDLFPTLISLEIDGMVCGRLKFIETNSVDIDRNGPKARVLPFAQKEMVERFLYGLDGKSQSDIEKFARGAVADLRKAFLSQLSFDDENDRAEIEVRAKNAEAAFLSGLKKAAFEKIRSQSQAEIEDMVEFMPKPELAQMAEALVELTSVKRRVSRGMETVGGPIDVAVISQAEGFVWVKRKHYFPSELNARYFARVRSQVWRQEVANGQHEDSGSLGAPGSAKTPP